MGKNSFNGEPGLSTNPLDVQGITNTLGDVQIVDDVVPSVTNAFRVGTTTLRWLSGNMTTTITDNITSLGDVNVNPTLETVMVKTLRPSVTGTVTLGTGSFRWGTLHSVNTVTDNISSGGDVNINPTLNVVLVKTTRPSVTNSIDLGTSSFTWATIHGNTLQCATVTSPATLTLTPTSDVIMAKTVRPSVTGTVALGTSTFRWGSLESVNTVTDTISSGGDVNINPTLNVVLVKTTRPSVTDSIDLGTASTRWANVHGTSLHCTNLTGPGSTVVVQKNLVPDGGVTLGASGNSWSLMFASQITAAISLTLNATNTIEVGTPVLQPSSDNTTDLGALSRRYKKLWSVDGAITNLLETPKVSTSSGNLTITCNTGNVIVSERPIRPDITATHPLGSLTLRWSTVFTGTTDSSVAVISPLLGATTGNTTLRAGSGAEIRADEVLVPSVNNTLSCGLSSRRWSTLFATTVDATTVIGTTLGATIGNTTLVAGVGSAVRSSLDFIPTAPTLNVGSATNVWENGYFKNLVVTASANYKSFNMGALTLTSNTFVKMPIFIGGGGPFDAGSNQIRFPKAGLYSISFTSKGDPGVLIVNAALFRVWNVTTATAASDPDGLLHDFGGQPALPRDQFFFYVDITNASHIIEIQYRRSNFDITNFSIADGMISAVHTTS